METPLYVPTVVPFQQFVYPHDTFRMVSNSILDPATFI